MAVSSPRTSMCAAFFAFRGMDSPGRMYAALFAFQ